MSFDPAPSTRRTPASTVLESLSPSADSSRIGIGDIIRALDDRAWGVAILALAFPCLIPMPIPGFGLVFGAPLLVLSLQLSAGQKRPWLPHILSKQSLDFQTWQKGLQMALPKMRKVEKILRYRVPWASSPTGERITGLMMAIVSILLLLPVPFTNIPLGIILCLLGLGLFERDGVILMVAWTLSIMSLGVFSGIILFGGKAVLSLLP